ncbi:MAG: type II toxin-antitoxin system VapC family toxin [Kiritimatiellae bacterium]|nr:type II toxin-antitoxin system VapC family toxin [Kiritimatiellia bacterium]
MKLLLDTNIVLCFQREDQRLSTEVKNLILDEKNQKFISMASIWEVSIKFSLGKLHLKKGLKFWLQELENVEDLALLPIVETHVLKSAELPFFHRDPFDRLIFAQSVVENMRLLSLDAIFDRYRIDMNC